MPHPLQHAALLGLLAGVAACAPEPEPTEVLSADPQSQAYQALAEQKRQESAARLQDLRAAADPPIALPGNACSGKNVCKGLGGCQTEAHSCKGLNDCLGKGGCQISAAEQTALGAKRAPTPTP